MDLWKNDKLYDLINEAKVLQSRIYLRKKELKNDSNWSKRFIKLFTNGGVSTAMRILRNGEIEHPILQNNDFIDDMLVREKLEQLHPPSAVVPPDKILEIPLPRVVPHMMICLLTLNQVQ
ncbi:hypothetical protein GJ496_000061 [Pomphorhynchus laevis]|nr:hypothetical protein GJ496_000061 [Pomphorhynchus laevis]